MQKAETVLGVIRKRGEGHHIAAETITGEPGAGKLARRVREGADGKGPTRHLAGSLLHSMRGGWRGTQAGPVAYSTGLREAGRCQPDEAVSIRTVMSSGEKGLEGAMGRPDGTGPRRDAEHGPREAQSLGPWFSKSGGRRSV
jgi:hypothetical protein